MALQVTTETKAVLTAQQGRVVGFTKSDEPGLASLAVPNDRAQLNPTQLRELAAWANEAASEIERRRTAPLRPNPRTDWLATEKLIRRGML
jgi:hypothetical protein